MESRQSGRQKRPPKAPSCGPENRIARQNPVRAGFAQVQVKLWSFKRSEIEVSHGGYLFAKSLDFFIFYTGQRQVRLVWAIFPIHTNRRELLINSTCQLVRFG